jgi:hypothetical protein
MFKNTFIFLSLYWLLASPPGTYRDWYAAVFMMMFSAFGLSYLVSNLVRPEFSLIISVVVSAIFTSQFDATLQLCVVVSVTSGFSPTVSEVDSYTPLQVLWWVSYTRWAGESFFLNIFSLWPYMRTDMAVVKAGYKVGNWGMDMGMLFLIGLVWRAIAYAAMRWHHRVKK